MNQDPVTRDLLAAMTARERYSETFIERVAIIEEGCKIHPVEALIIARRKGER